MKTCLADPRITPSRWSVERIVKELYDYPSLSFLLKNKKIENLYLCGCTGLTSLPEGLKVGGNLSLYGCIGLTSLPEGLKVGRDLNLWGCTGLKNIPDKYKDWVPFKDVKPYLRERPMIEQRSVK